MCTSQTANPLNHQIIGHSNSHIHSTASLVVVFYSYRNPSSVLNYLNTATKFLCFDCIFNIFGDLGVACWPLVPKLAGSNPDEAVGFLGRKILSTPSFGGEVKPSVPCRRFAACKRSLNLGGSRNLDKITGNFLAHSSTFRY